MSTSYKGKVLVGKSNYLEWLSDAKLYLEINGYMPYITQLEVVPNKDLYYNISEIEDKPDKAKSNELAVRYYERLSDFNRNDAKALGALKSIISRDIIERFKDKPSSYNLYKAIQDTFSESSLDTIGRFYSINFFWVT